MLRLGEGSLIIRLTLIVFAVSPLLGQDTPFGSGLYQVTEKAACRSCHNPDGVASGTRLQFPDPGSAPEKIEAFGRSLVTLVERDRPEGSLLLNKPTGRLPHGGGERIKPGSPDEAVLKAWVAKLAQLSGAELAQALKYREGEATGAGHTIPKADLRRLTHSQFNNTVRDLLGDQTAPANQFPAEDFINGFRNQSQQRDRTGAGAHRQLHHASETEPQRVWGQHRRSGDSSEV